MADGTPELGIGGVKYLDLGLRGTVMKTTEGDICVLIVPAMEAFRVHRTEVSIRGDAPTKDGEFSISLRKLRRLKGSGSPPRMVTTSICQLSAILPYSFTIARSRVQVRAYQSVGYVIPSFSFVAVAVLVPAAQRRGGYHHPQAF